MGIDFGTIVTCKYAGTTNVVGMAMSIDNCLYRFGANLVEFSFYFFRRHNTLCGINNDQTLIALDHDDIGEGVANSHMNVIAYANYFFSEFIGMFPQLGQVR